MDELTNIDMPNPNQPSSTETIRKALSTVQCSMADFVKSTEGKSKGQIKDMLKSRMDENNAEIDRLETECQKLWKALFSL